VRDFKEGSTMEVSQRMAHCGGFSDQNPLWRFLRSRPTVEFSQSKANCGGSQSGDKQNDFTVRVLRACPTVEGYRTKAHYEGFSEQRPLWKILKAMLTVEFSRACPLCKFLRTKPTALVSQGKAHSGGFLEQGPL